MEKKQAELARQRAAMAAKRMEAGQLDDLSTARIGMEVLKGLEEELAALVFEDLGGHNVKSFFMGKDGKQTEKVANMIPEMIRKCTRKGDENKANTKT